jgi:hypothetical protein
MKKLILAAFMVCVVSPAWGDAFQSGNGLHTLCQDKKGSFNNGACHGYIIGVFDALNGADRGIGGTVYCRPTGAVTQGQIVAVLKNWLNKNPQHRHFTAPSLAVAAFSEAFPCK